MKQLRLRMAVADMFPMNDVGLWALGEPEIFVALSLELGKPPDFYSPDETRMSELLGWWDRLHTTVDRYFIGNVPVETEKAAKARKTDRFIAWLDGSLE